MRQAPLGTFVFTLLVNAAVAIPVVGLVAPTVAAAAGLGTLCLTRFGACNYIRTETARATGCRPF